MTNYDDMTAWCFPGSRIPKLCQFPSQKFRIWSQSISSISVNSCVAALPGFCSPLISRHFRSLSFPSSLAKLSNRSPSHQRAITTARNHENSSGIATEVSIALNKFQKTPTFQSTFLSYRKEVVLNDIEERYKQIVESLQEFLRPWEDVITEYDTCKVLQQLSNPKLAMTFFLWARKRPFVQTDVYVYTTLVGILSKAMDAQAVDWVFEEMRKAKCNPNMWTYCRVINAYGKLNMVKEAEAIWTQMKANGIQADHVVYGTMIDMYVKAGQNEKALEMYKEMGVLGFPPSVVVQTILINLFIKTENTAKAKEIFERMLMSDQPPNVVTWTSMINLYGKAGRVTEAMEAFEQMKQYGIKPGIATYGSVIDICGKAGMFPRVNELLKSMQREGVKPDAKLLCSMTANLGRYNEPDKAKEYFGEMVRIGIEPNTECFTALMSVFLRAKRYREVEEVAADMQKQNCLPNVVVFNILLFARTECDDREGERVLQRLMEVASPSINQFVQRLTREGRREEGEQALRWEVGRLGEILSREKPGSRIELCNSLIEFLMRIGQRKRAQQLWGLLRHYWPKITSADKKLLQQQSWEVDLHSMSERTALVALRSELVRLKAAACSNPAFEFPAQAAVITGWGKRSNETGNSVVKQAVQAFLDSSNSPFVTESGNGGYFVAGGAEFRKWLFLDSVDAKLREL